MNWPCQQRRAGLVLAATSLFVSGPTSAIEVATSKEAQSRRETKVIVALRPLSRASEPPLISRWQAAGRLRHRFSAIPAVAASLTADEIAALRNDSSVAYVEPDLTFEASPTVPSAEETASWGVARIGAAVAHARGITGASVKVAVLDTGVDYTHPELSPRFRGGYNFMDDTADPLDDAFDSHGTQVSGIIAASLDGNGMVGVAPGVSLYGVKVLDGGGFGDLSTILAGIDWAIANRMDVVNMSFGTIMESQALEDACNAAANAGIVLVAATGYDRSDPVSYPAAYASVIGVSATDESDVATTFSPAGPGVTVVAPGVSILSTEIGGGYVALSGTSQAAPHVAGLAALILSSGISDANGDGRRSDEVRERIQRTARDLGAAGRDDQYGYKLVDAATALDLCQANDYELVRTSLFPLTGVRTLSLAASTFEVKLANHGLIALLAYASSKDAAKGGFFKLQLLNPRSTAPVTTHFMLQAPNEIWLVPVGPVGSWAQMTVTDKGTGCN
jgi:subtilisin